MPNDSKMGQSLQTLLSVQSSPGLLSIPLKLRQRIYQFCGIPQGLLFTCSDSMHTQHRPKGWPKRHPRSGRSCDDSERITCSHCAREATCRDIASASAGGGQPELPVLSEQQIRGIIRSGPSVRRLYCSACGRYRPYVPLQYQSALPGLLLVCWQITDEVETMLYGGNTFRVIPHLGISMLGPRQRAKMQSVILVLRPRGLSYTSDFRMDTKAWDGAFTGLNQLQIIAEQPTTPPNASYQAVPWSILGEWSDWLRPILKHLSQTLPETAEVVVDDNNEQFTTRIVEAILPKRCHFAEHPDGDYVFRRRENLAWARPQYWDDGYGPPTDDESVIEGNVEDDWDRWDSYSDSE